MLVAYFRGRGWLVPLLFVSSALCMIPSHEVGVRACRAMMLAWLLLGGAWVAWYGARSLRLAAAALGRPLRVHEWFLDLGYLRPRPFQSFMFVQMPWWTLAFALACCKLAASL
jgi:hypothetical protein